LLSSIIFTKHRICEWNSFDKDLLDLENVILNEKKKINPFLTLSFYESPQLQKTSAEIFVKNEYNDKNNQNYKFNNQAKKKLRIAYYSADFRNHPMSYLLANLYELHDKNKFEIIGISFGPDKNDEMRKRVSSAFDKFYDLRLKTEDEIVKFSRELKIDIAIDLMCFTKYHKFGIFVKKCAPIQVNYLGYPGTSGTNYLDYIIADKILIPKESQKHYSEKIVYLPDTYQANDSTKKIADKIFTREELGLPKDGFVFCCFNNNYKITPQVFDVWMRLLEKVENSVLWILSEDINISKNLKKEATIRGIDFNRIVFAERIKMNEHLARQKVADLFIDTFPYTGHTTASDALWVGLPVLTRIGKSFASRVSASLLNAIGLSELVTNSEKEYEDLAIELAKNPPKLKEIKNKLKNNRNTKPLFNTQIFARNMEKAYSLMYERYLKNLPLDNIEIN
jgi:predicted O-linked N-acetylglucosamine transferase (SPINDLY family)